MAGAAEWKLDANDARLNLGSHRAAIDLAAPQRGLHQLVIAEQLLKDCEVLGVELESVARGGGPVLADAYQRGGDLIATYAQAPSSMVSTQIYWRAALREFEGVVCPTIDLQVSVQTSRLDSHPAVHTHGRLPTCEVVRAGIDRPDSSHAREPGSHCVVFRPSAWNESYAEMVHPEDADGCEIGQPNDATIEIVHRLFERELEKGVILRARVRGLFVPRPRDAAIATAAWRQFLEQPPPLTT
ncbi:MAG TPA: hypothetical protein VF306_22415 [Pirellulales bacterium]